MNYNRPNYGYLLAKMKRIDSKCDRILTELILLRHQDRTSDLDEVIDRLHLSAQRLRENTRAELLNLHR